MLHQLGHIPRESESFRYDGWQFTVLEVDNHRVARVKLEKFEERPQPAGRL